MILFPFYFANFACVKFTCVILLLFFQSNQMDISKNNIVLAIMQWYRFIFQYLSFTRNTNLHYFEYVLKLLWTYCLNIAILRNKDAKGLITCCTIYFTSKKLTHNVIKSKLYKLTYSYVNISLACFLWYRFITVFQMTTQKFQCFIHFCKLVVNIFNV